MKRVYIPLPGPVVEVEVPVVDGDPNFNTLAQSGGTINNTADYSGVQALAQGNRLYPFQPIEYEFSSHMGSAADVLIGSASPVGAPARQGNVATTTVAGAFNIAAPQQGNKLATLDTTYLRRAGSNSVAQTAVGGRTDWADIANASGVNNGTAATIQGNALAARGGRLDLSYANFASKNFLTIDSAVLLFYVSQSGTAFDNGSLTLQYNLGAGIQTITTFTGNEDFLTTPYSFDLSGLITNLSDLDSLTAHISFSSLALQTYAATCDAAVLSVEASQELTL